MNFVFFLVFAIQSESFFLYTRTALCACLHFTTCGMKIVKSKIKIKNKSKSKIKPGTSISGHLDKQGLLSALTHATYIGDILRVKRVLTAGAKELVPARGFPACLLVRAAALQSSSILTLLLKAGAAPSGLSCAGCRTSAGAARMTALHSAVSKGTVRSIGTLLAHGAQVDATDGTGRTPLWYLSNRRQYYRPLCDARRSRVNVQAVELKQILQLFVAAGANVDAAKTRRTADNWRDGDGEEGTTLLHIAAERGDAELVQALLAAGADVTLKSKQGKTALGWTHGDWPDVHAMLAAQADWATGMRRRWLLQCRMGAGC